MANKKRKLKTIKIIPTKSIGFCSGVRRAVEEAEAALKTRRTPIYSIGPIIHNPPEMERLTRLGLKVVKRIDAIPRGACLLIRSHGADPAELAAAGKRDLTLIDASCRIVKRLQAAYRSLAREGYQVIVIGDRNHPEVKGVLGQGKAGGRVIDFPEEVENLKLKPRIGVVAQTTQPRKRVQEVIECLIPRTGEIKFINTLCPVTSLRQREARDLARRVNTMLVIGGKNSANSSRLFELCQEVNPHTYQIERVDELKPGWLKNGGSVGLTTGTSTPSWLINLVVEEIQQIGGWPGKTRTERRR